MNTLIAVALTVGAYVPPTGGALPPGTEGISTIIQWVMGGVSAVLFAIFITGLVKAGNARNRGGEADVAAPVWPLVAAIVLGAAAGIWAAI